VDQDLKNVSQYLKLHIEKVLDLFRFPDEFDGKLAYYRNLYKENQITVGKFEKSGPCYMLWGRIHHLKQQLPVCVGVKMNNPGIDLEIWKQLRRKWTELDASGYKVKVEFRLIADPDDENKILVIDVIQNVNDEVIIETVQRNAGEAYATLGIAGLSMERLVGVYKEMMHQLHRQAKQRDVDLIVIMVPSSSTSGEIRGYMEKPDSDIKSNVLVNYRHYYMLNALQEKMRELVGDRWSKVKAIYHSGGLEFYFEY
jgi:hypothetical protein